MAHRSEVPLSGSRSHCDPPLPMIASSWSRLAPACGCARALRRRPSLCGLCRRRLRQKRQKAEPELRPPPPRTCGCGLPTLACGGGRNIGRAESGTTNNVSSPHRPPTEWAERRLARTHDYDWHVHRADFDVRALVRHLASGSVHFRSPARSQICASGSVRLVACALANLC